MRNILAAVLGTLLVLGVAGGTTYFFLNHVQRQHQALAPGSASVTQWTKGVKLTPEQKKKLEPLEASLKKDLDGLQLQLAKERMSICSIMREETQDTAKIVSYVSKVSALEGQQQRRVIQHLLDIRAILTPEQKDKFFAAIMHDVCENCRMATNTNDCLCGMCKIKKV